MGAEIDRIKHIGFRYKYMEQSDDWFWKHFSRRVTWKNRAILKLIHFNGRNQTVSEIGALLLFNYFPFRLQMKFHGLRENPCRECPGTLKIFVHGRARKIFQTLSVSCRRSPNR